MEELNSIVAKIKIGTPKWVRKARKEHYSLDVHINGNNTAKYLTTIDTIENANQFHLRQKFLDTNKYVMHSLALPIDKVFSAKGGGVLYNLPNEAKEKTLREHLSNVRHGKRLRKWIKDVQANKFYTDPAGLVFFEWDKKSTYPTMKSITCIMNYSCDGRMPEWVLFEPTQELNANGEETGAKLYRYVNSEFDTVIRESNGEYTEAEGERYVNPFKKVPAIINSDTINSDLTHNKSPFDAVISLADHYLRTGTIKNLNEFLHGYPIFWRYVSDCKHCQGTGYIGGEQCTHCGGTGKNLTKDITDVINLERPEADETAIAPDVAGYVTPDVASLQEMRTEQEYIKGLMEVVMWGSRMATDATNETATAAFLRVQPANDKLNSFSDAFEDMEKKMTDLIGEFYLKNYKGSSVNYGRRYLVESPDAIWTKYEQARREGSSKVALDYLLIQFYQSEFSNDIESLTIAQKGVKLEPFIHKTDEEVVNLPVEQIDKTRKLYFNEWYKQLDDITILSADVNKLSAMFDQYIASIIQVTIGSDGVSGEDVPDAVDVEAEAKARLKGSVGGVQGILGIQSAVATGQTQYDAGLSILNEIYGFSDEVAKSILGNPKNINNENV